MKFAWLSLGGFRASGFRAWVRRIAPALRAPASVALLIIGAAGLAFRIVVARWSHGSNDINLWNKFCEQFEAHHSLGWLYDNEPYFNHPPGMALVVIGLHKLSLAKDWRFDFLFKLPQVAAEILTAVLI